MNKLGLVLVLAGLLFLIYAIICKNKINIFNRSDRFVVVNEKEFFKLQFYLSIFNAVCMIIFGVIVVIYNLSNFIIISYPLVFHIINSFLISACRRRGYIKLVDIT